MKNRNRAVAVLLALSLVIAGCSTSSTVVAYRTVAAVKLSVDTAMTAWADRVVTGKTVPAQEAQVQVAFAKYTDAARAAAAVMRASTDTAPPNLANAADALLNLLAAFGVQVK